MNESFVFHVMGNRFSDSNPGTCLPGDKLAATIEEDPEGMSILHVFLSLLATDVIAVYCGHREALYFLVHYCLR